MATVKGHGLHKGARRGAVDGGKIWWVAPDYPTAAEIWRDLKRATRNAWTHKDEIERRVELPGGGSITVKSAHDPESLVAVGLDGLVIDEAAKVKPEAWHEFLRPTLSDTGGWAIFISTPRGHNWFKDLFDYAATAPGWARWQRPTSDNPLVPAEELAAAERDAPRYYGQEYLAQFTTLEGAEWPHTFFPDSIWFDDWPTDIGQKVMSLDPSKGKSAKSGDYSAFVMLGLDSDWKLWVDADLARRPVEGTAPSIVEDGIALCLAWQPHAFSVEINGFQELVVEAFARHARERHIHLPLWSVNSSLPKPSRIRQIGTYLAQGRIRFRNTPGTRLLVQQLRDFPNGAFDDGPDALAQAVVLMDQLVTGQGQGDVPVVWRA